MARSLNKAQLIGRLGKDPEVKKFANGGSVVTFSVATSDQWKDRSTGERREKTEWHRVAIFNEAVGRVAEQYLRKGDQVYIEGKMETRKWTDQSGQEKFVTEVVIRPYSGEMTLLGGAREGSGRDDRGGASGGYGQQGYGRGSDTGSQRREAPDDRGSASGSGNDYGYGYGSGGSGRRSFDDDIPF